jgi:GTP-binding protein EngB required for normal cell division
MQEQDHSGDSKKPLIVFAGRSNVGKSSTIRALTGKKVRVGKRPGSTRWEQFIDLGPVELVDIPGFGYMAGQSKDTIEKTKRMIVQKLEKWSHRIAISVLIVDISLFRELVERWEHRGEIPIDIEFYGFLSEVSSRVIVVANKSDKVKKRLIDDELAYLDFKLKEALPESEPTIVTLSATKKKGIRKLSSLIESELSGLNLPAPTW